MTHPIVFLIPKEWKSGIPDSAIVYTIYDRETKHCNLSRLYRSVIGDRYTCTHYRDPSPVLSNEGITDTS